MMKLTGCGCILVGVLGLAACSDAAADGASATADHLETARASHVCETSYRTSAVPSEDGKFVFYPECRGDERWVRAIVRHELASGVQTNVAEYPEGSQIWIEDLGVQGSTLFWVARDHLTTSGFMENDFTIHARDVALQTAERSWAPPPPVPGNAEKWLSRPKLTPDGQHIAVFASAHNGYAKRLYVGDTGSAEPLMVFTTYLPDEVLPAPDGSHFLLVGARSIRRVELGPAPSLGPEIPIHLADKEAFASFPLSYADSYDGKTYLATTSVWTDNQYTQYFLDSVDAATGATKQLSKAMGTSSTEPGPLDVAAPIETSGDLVWYSFVDRSPNPQPSLLQRVSRYSTEAPRTLLPQAAPAKLSKDGSTLLAWYPDPSSGQYNLYRIPADGSAAPQLVAPVTSGFALLQSEGGRHLVRDSQSGPAYLIDDVTGATVARWDAHSEDPRALVLSKDGSTVYTSRPCATGREIARLSGGEKVVVACSPDVGDRFTTIPNSALVASYSWQNKALTIARPDAP